MSTMFVYIYVMTTHVVYVLHIQDFLYTQHLCINCGVKGEVYLELPLLDNN